VYDDTYSSSPEAAISVIRALTEQNPDNVSAVLGDMLELGEHCEMLHKAVGAAAAKCGIRNLYLFGTYAKHTADGAFECGMPKERVFVNAKEDLESTARQIRDSYAGEVLIVKASHAIHAERLFDFLKD
jgi:UDP-N-acetylmuramoyl-tripeptide--D-alanyl-D-alanine ligase